MKKYFLVLIFLFTFSMVSATDCWQLTSENGKPECFYISFDGCENTYYDEYLNCKRDLLDYEFKTKNIIQTTVESLNPDYEGDRINKLYDYSNSQILLSFSFLFILYWILKNQ